MTRAAAGAITALVVLGGVVATPQTSPRSVSFLGGPVHPAPIDIMVRGLPLPATPTLEPTATMLPATPTPVPAATRSPTPRPAPVLPAVPAPADRTAVQAAFIDGWYAGGGSAALLESALRRIQCESGWDIYAHNGPYDGLGQWDGTWYAYGGGDIYSPWQQGHNMAVRVRRDGGFGAWGCA